MNLRWLPLLCVALSSPSLANGVGKKTKIKATKVKAPTKPKEVQPLIQTPWMSMGEAGVEFFVAEAIFDPLDWSKERAYRITGGSKSGLMKGDLLVVFRGEAKAPVAELELFDVQPGRSFARVRRRVNPKRVAGLRYHSVMVGDLVSLIENPEPRVWQKPKPKRKRRRRIVRRQQPKPFAPKAGMSRGDSKILVGGRELPTTGSSPLQLTPAQKATDDK